MAAVSLQSLVYSLWPDFYQYKHKIQNSDVTKGKICSSPTNCTNKNQFTYKVCSLKINQSYCNTVYTQLHSHFLDLNLLLKRSLSISDLSTILLIIFFDIHTSKYSSLSKSSHFYALYYTRIFNFCNFVHAAILLCS